MKITSFVLLIVLLSASCAEEKSKEFPLKEEKFEKFIMNHQYESFFESKDSSCIRVITKDQLKAMEEITIQLGNDCDSLEIEIPPGGTITSATLYTDSTRQNPIAEVPGFAIGQFVSNHFTLSSSLRGRYFLNYGSCHWWSELWVNFE